MAGGHARQDQRHEVSGRVFARLLARLHRFAEAVAALILAMIFIAFILQIVLRYAFNWPVGWTTELSLAGWLWLVLWGAAFVLKDDEEIRIDFLAGRVGPLGRRVMGIAGAAGIIALFGMSLPASWSYVTFMKVENSSYLGVRMDFMYSIYIVFAVAVILRNVRHLVRLLRGKDAAPPDPTVSASAL
jgi:TRAP-type C4-dicarboxylate transport system permease small subunit